MGHLAPMQALPFYLCHTQKGAKKIIKTFRTLLAREVTRVLATPPLDPLDGMQVLQKLA